MTEALLHFPRFSTSIPQGYALRSFALFGPVCYTLEFFFFFNLFSFSLDTVKIFFLLLIFYIYDILPRKKIDLSYQSLNFEEQLNLQLLTF